MNDNIRICHLADTQIEVTRSSTGNRYDEFDAGLETIVADVANEKPDIIVYTGDLFQYHTATMEELSLTSTFLRKLQMIAPVVIINGNHEFLRASRTGITRDFKTQTTIDPIEFVVNQIDSKNIVYFKRTGFYEDVFGMNWAVWSQFEKFNKDQSDLRPYSPWELPNGPEYKKQMENGLPMIELFHDPIAGAKGFDGTPEVHFQNHKITLNSFNCKTILAGDIHAPDIRWSEAKDRLFTFCSSTIMRNYGEGNYYRDNIVYQAGNNMHGFNVVEVDNMGKPLSCEFKKVVQPVGRHTMQFSKDYVYTPENIANLNIQNHKFNRIRLVVEDNVQAFFENQDLIVETLKSKFNCIIDDISYDKNMAIDFDDDLTIEDADKIANQDTILELSRIYIDNVIDKTKSVSEEDKEDVKSKMKQLFAEELAKHFNADKNLRKTVLHDARISNFMTFTDDVEVDFGSRGITKIGGSNAVGKTKLMSFICWMFTDLISASQSASRHKQNRLMVFNIFRPNDYVEGEISFSVNGARHVLTKRVERAWKRGENKYNEEGWQNHINGTPTMEIEIKSKDFNSSDYDEIMAYLRELITFDEFELFTKVDQASLKNLLHMHPDNLISSILKIIGLNFFDDLNAAYDEVRQDMLDKNPNPGGDIQEYLEQIAEHDNVLENFIELNLQLEERKKSLNENAQKHTTELATINALLDTLGDKTQVAQDLVNVGTVISNLDSQINSLKSANEKHDSVSKQYDTESFRNTVQEHKAALDKNVADRLELNKAQTSEAELRQAKLTELQEFAKKKEEEKKPKIDELNATIEKHRNSNNDYTSKILGLDKTVLERQAEERKDLQFTVNNLTESKNAVEKRISDLNHQNSLAESGIKQLNQLIESNNEKVDNLNKSTTCPTCSQEITGAARENIDKQIQDTNQSSEDCRDSIKEIENKTSEISEHLTAANNDLNDVKRTLESRQAELNSIVRTIENYPDLISLSVQYNEKITANNDAMIELNNKIVELNSDQSYMQQSPATDIAAEIHKSDARKEANKKLIDSLLVDHPILHQTYSEANGYLEQGIHATVSMSKAQTEITRLNGLVQLEKQKSEQLNEKLQQINAVQDKYERRDEIQKSIDELKIEANKLDKEFNELSIKNSKADEAKKDCLFKIEQLKQYQLASSIIRQYKAMLGKSGLQKYIFAKVIDIINSKLNELLEDVDFRLYFDKETLHLRKLDMKTQISSDCIFTSGMETSVLGLALLDSLLILNQTKKLNLLFIDEISGQMNSGEELTYEARNYQLLLTKLIKKIAKNTDIYIVDHVLKTLGEKRTLEVRKTSDGSKIKELKFDTY